MIFRQFSLEALGHASYLIGSEKTGEAMVVDVRRDVSHYYDFARAKGLTIRIAADTHQHNDYLTGITELEQRGSLELLAGARAQLGYEAKRMEDRERFRMGELEFELAAPASDRCSSRRSAMRGA
jgi:hydroxyacylglutathione hydrolase